MGRATARRKENKYKLELKKKKKILNTVEKKSLFGFPSNLSVLLALPEQQQQHRHFETEFFNPFHCFFLHLSEKNIYLKWEL
jgi:hypothetical protein